MKEESQIYAQIFYFFIIRFKLGHRKKRLMFLIHKIYMDYVYNLSLLSMQFIFYELCLTSAYNMLLV